jgi:hypothetical protein
VACADEVIEADVMAIQLVSRRYRMELLDPTTGAAAQAIAYATRPGP